MLSEASWRLLESLGGALGALGAVLEVPWDVLGVLEASKRHLGSSWAVLELSWELWRPCWSHLESSPSGFRRVLTALGTIWLTS